MLISTLLFLNLGSGEIMLVLLFVLLFFGSKSIPDLARGLGKGMREMKDAMNSVQREINREVNQAQQAVTQHVDEIKKDMPDLNTQLPDVTKDLKID